MGNQYTSNLRNKTTQEEREKQLINKKENNYNALNKISEYLSKPNVKKFNAILVDKSFNRVHGSNIFGSREELENELKDYFILCNDYDIIPTISSMALYLGVHRDTMYEYMNNSVHGVSDIIKLAVATCQSYQEAPALDGTLSAPTWIFTAKNYFGMRDTQDVNFSANQNQQSNSNINNIREQIDLEHKNLLIDAKNTENSN